jgi:hypothetical protein
MHKKLFKNLLVPTLGLTLGAQVVQGIGGPVAPQAGAAFSSAANFLPALGSITGGMLVLNETRKLGKLSLPINKKSSRYHP